ncbi:MAG: hypothetical protein SVW02_04185 [Candidatus Nanohaloarchaea archaeon]|nr:hypothetical protein [Candidatus Nanohaloarchaea archaeon]
MYCGILLTGDTDEASSVAFLDDGAVETFSAATNDDILGLLEEHRPEVTTLNAAPRRERETEFRSGEEDLIEEGHAMLPQGMRDRAVLERADHLSRHIEASGIGTTLIETNARVASERLGLGGDEDLEAEGIDTGGIETVWEYDAVVLAVVAKLYADNRCEEYGIVVPADDVESI